MSTLYFIRHGQASFGRDNYDRLSEKGEAQSRLLGRHLMRLGIRFDSIYAGTLERHSGTAAGFRDACAAEKVTLPPVRTLPGLDEYDSKAILTALIPVLLEEHPEMKEHAERLLTDKKSFQFVFEKVMLMWASGDYPRTDLVSWREFVAAVNGAIDAVMRSDGRGKHVALFTSGGPVSVAVMRALSLSDAVAMQLRDQIVNTSVTRFKCTEDRFMLSSFNDYTHIELADRNLVTYR